MGEPWRAVYLAEDWMVADAGAQQGAPADWWTGGIGAVLDRLAPRFAGEGAVLVAGDTLRLLGLPTHPDMVRDRRGKVAPISDHPLIGEAAAAGWRCSGVGDWTRFRADGRASIHVGAVDLMDLSLDKHGRTLGTPLYGPTPADMVRACAAWHQLTGSAYRGTPGMAGMAVMEALAPQRDDERRGKPPTWKPRTIGPDNATEQDYKPSHWRGPRPDGALYSHGYDAIRAYIAAAMLAEVCPWTLKPTGKTPWNPRLAGWWLVELGPWNEPRLPNPAGYPHDETQREVRWVTGPTMALLAELTARGMYGGVRVLDSWTGPARDHVLRPWAERMRDAFTLHDPAGKSLPNGWLIGEDVERIRLALKLSGRQTLGLLDRSSNWAHRPDWWYSVVALARANLFRKMLKASVARRWPLLIDVDQVFYPSDERDPRTAAPSAFPIDQSGMKFGSFTTKKSYRLAR